MSVNGRISIPEIPLRAGAFEPHQSKPWAKEEEPRKRLIGKEPLLLLELVLVDLALGEALLQDLERALAATQR
jgi:hypothetical protein